MLPQLRQLRQLRQRPLRAVIRVARASARKIAVTSALLVASPC